MITEDDLYERIKTLEYEKIELQEENEKLKEIVENLTTMTVCGDKKQIKNTAQYKLEIAQLKIKKAIERIKISLSQGGPRETRDLVDGYDLLEILEGDEK